MSYRATATTAATTEDGGVYIEYTDDTGATRRVPTTLPIQPVPHYNSEGLVDFPTTRVDATLLSTDDSAILVVTHDYLVQCDLSLQALHIYPARRLRYLGCGSDSEPGLGYRPDQYGFACYVDTGFSSLQSIEFCGVENIRQIRNDFLWCCHSLKTIDLTPFRNVTSIGSNFMRGCKFTSVDLTPLSSVTEVGNSLFSDCPDLITIDLSPLSKITKLGGIVRCTSLTSINLSALTNVTEIASMFLFMCTSLTQVDLSAFTNKLKTAGRQFVNACGISSTIDLTPFRKFTSIPCFFLSGAGPMTFIDLTPLSNVTTIGDSFIGGMSSLTSIDLSPLCGVTSIGSYFLDTCSSLTSIDLSPLSNVVTIGLFFMPNCTSLKKIDLRPLVMGKLMTSIDKTFMKKTKGLSAPKRKEFVQMMNDKISGSTPAAATTPRATTARKVVVKAAGKKKK